MKAKTVWVHIAVREHPCPHCRRPLANSYHAENVKPSPGDVTFCNGCGKPSVFTADYQLRPMSDAEIAAAPPEFHKVAARMAEILQKCQRR